MPHQHSMKEISRVSRPIMWPLGHPTFCIEYFGSHGRCAASNLSVNPRTALEHGRSIRFSCAQANFGLSTPSHTHPFLLWRTLLWSAIIAGTTIMSQALVESPQLQWAKESLPGALPTRSLALASFCLFAYDSLITLDQEVHLIMHYLLLLLC